MKEKIINFLEGKRILILGFGREGKSAYEFLKQNVNCEEIAVADKNEVEVPSGIKTFFGDNYLDAVKDYELVIKSPGIIIKNYISDEDKKKITSLTDLFLRFCPNTIIGVTGTKGKSTTASLIYHILKKCHYDTYLIGNIGVPCFNVIDDIKDDTILVYELSCHQLEFVKASPKISVLLNLYEEHLDHYNSIDDYVKAKQNIYKYQTKDDYLIYGDVYKYMNEEEINKIASHKISINDDSEVSYDEIKTSLIGDHNKKNIVTAIMATSLAGVSKTDALKAVKSFKGLEHRLEYVGCFNDIKFYNDSIATAQEAVINAVKALNDVDTIILGGMDRGLDYNLLVDFLLDSNVKNILLLPDTSRPIKAIFDRHMHSKNIYMVNDMEDAVKKAYEVTEKGKTALLSPAAASYGFYLNFEKRGEDFKRLVKKYAKK